MLHGFISFQNVLREEVKEKMVWSIDRTSPSSKIRDLMKWSKDILKDIYYQRKILSNPILTFLTKNWFVFLARLSKGPATRNDIVDDFVTIRVLDAIFAMLKSISSAMDHRRFRYMWHGLKVVLAECKVKTPCHANGVFINKC